ncbi:hypothetical protein [Sporomusa aerivorans]|uniref:hypothetical protein n=1 Tax=Sporomusa aerivorans TaxID=204936 RepID=UPI00352B3BA5
MDKQKLVTKVNEAGHAIDDSVESYAERHKFPKWKVWLGAAVVLGLVLVVICH